MSDPSSSLSNRTQTVIVCLLVLPWLALSIVSFDLLPTSWRFEHWPPAVRDASVAAFTFCFFAEVAFHIWYWVVTSKRPVDE